MEPKEGEVGTDWDDKRAGEEVCEAGAGFEYEVVRFRAGLTSSPELLRTGEVDDSEATLGKAIYLAYNTVQQKFGSST